ncbi:MAG: hypothetical protein AMXMBFR59_17330 [Rhodanobacteraceae bacterium]
MTALATALLGLAPVLFAATDLYSGMALGGGIAAAWVVLTLTLALTRTTAPSAFGITLWATLAAAVASWLIAAGLAPAPPVIAVLPLAAANAVWWRLDLPPAATLQLDASLALAPLAVGALRGAADTLLAQRGRTPLTEMLSWLSSPPGLLVLTALLAALHQSLCRRPAPPPAQDPPTA